VRTDELASTEAYGARGLEGVKGGEGGPGRLPDV
jgi:hypothetical protein